MRKAIVIAAIGLASVGIGTALAVSTPTDLRSARNAGLADLSQPTIVAYPGQAAIAGGADSYQVVYSPQYLAVIAARDRARAKQFELPAYSPAAYDPPADPQPVAQPDYRDSNDDAVAADQPVVTVRRGATSAEPLAGATSDAVTGAVPEPVLARSE